MNAGWHHPFDAILLPRQATSSSERLHLGELATRGFGAARVGGQMTCPSAIAGTANKAVTKRYFDPSLMGVTPFVERYVYSQTRADIVGLPGVASGNCAPCGIRSIGIPDAASILPVQLNNEMRAVAS